MKFDEERLRYILKNLERIDYILSMGDVLFTHCNLLHSSNRNTSGESRRVLLSCYNTKHNNPVKKHHHPRYKPIKKMPDNSIMNFSEIKFKPAYRQICRERDLYYHNVTEDIFSELIKREKNNLSKKSLSIAFQSLIMGLWLNQLDEPSKFSKSESKKICIDYLKTHFPKQFSRYS